jgi:tRNA(Ile)-lysidine synthase
LIEEGETRLDLPEGTLTIERLQGRPDEFPSDPNTALLDADKLAFPLRLRSWREGDVFCPLGMGGKRHKVKKFFVEKKVPLFEKEKIRILETANGDICWIVGHRLDERMKITEHTRQYVVFRYQKS